LTQQGKSELQARLKSLGATIVSMGSSGCRVTKPAEVSWEDFFKGAWHIFQDIAQNESNVTAA